MHTRPAFAPAPPTHGEAGGKHRQHYQSAIPPVAASKVRLWRNGALDI